MSLFHLCSFSFIWATCCCNPWLACYRVSICCFWRASETSISCKFYLSSFTREDSFSSSILLCWNVLMTLASSSSPLLFIISLLSLCCRTVISVFTSLMAARCYAFSPRRISIYLFKPCISSEFCGKSSLLFWWMIFKLPWKVNCTFFFYC